MAEPAACGLGEQPHRREGVALCLIGVIEHRPSGERLAAAKGAGEPVEATLETLDEPGGCTVLRALRRTDQMQSPDRKAKPAEIQANIGSSGHEGPQPRRDAALPRVAGWASGLNRKANLRDMALGQ